MSDDPDDDFFDPVAPFNVSWILASTLDPDEMTSWLARKGFEDPWDAIDALLKDPSGICRHYGPEG